MNLWFRLLRVLCKCLFVKKTKDVFTESRVSFRVWPNDLDINWHMNNGRYLTLMDLGRTHLMAQLDLLWKLPKKKWFPVVGGVSIQYGRPLDPFQKFEIITKLLSWDEKWFYVEQVFERSGKIHASAVLRALFLGPQGKITPEMIFRLAGIDEPEAPLLSLQDWKEEKIF